MSDFINMDVSNIEKEHICCAIGKGKHQKGEQLKRDWMREQFGNGLIFRKLDQRGKVFIELMPSELSFKPIIADNFFTIHCLWVSGKFKNNGLGRDLIQFAIDEAKRQDKAGLCVLAGAGNYLTSAKFYEYFGFMKVDETIDGQFSLMALNFLEDVTMPQIADTAKKMQYIGGGGVTVFTSNQCPFVPTCLKDLSKVVADLNLRLNVIQLRDHKEICASPSPFGTFGVFLNEKFITHEMQSVKGYEKIFAKYL